MNVLMVDDARLMTHILGNILRDMGHTIVGEARNGKDAVEQYKLLRPDLVTMDITMPEWDGIKALKEIIKHDSDANVIMVSAMGQQSFVLEAIQSGASEFIIKPFKTDQIKKAVRGCENKLREKNSKKRRLTQKK